MGLKQWDKLLGYKVWVVSIWGVTQIRPIRKEPLISANIGCSMVGLISLSPAIQIHAA